MDASRPGAPSALADAVRDEVAAAGLPVLPWEMPEAFPGTGVSIQAGPDDPAVWVGWAESDALRDAAVNALQAGAYRPDGSELHPAIRHLGVVDSAMVAAIAEILASAGFRVEKDADDLRPGELLVLERQSGPNWRDPVVPPLAGLSGYLPGARVRLTEGEYAGSVTVVRICRHINTADGPSYAYQVEHPCGTGVLDVPATAVTLDQEGN